VVLVGGEVAEEGGGNVDVREADRVDGQHHSVVHQRPYLPACAAGWLDRGAVGWIRRRLAGYRALSVEGQREGEAAGCALPRDAREREAPLPLPSEFGKI